MERKSILPPIFLIHIFLNRCSANFTSIAGTSRNKKYKELKSRLAIEEFSGATTTSVLQEFYINVLLSNLSSLIKNQVDEEIQITAKSTNKYRYQANRAFIIGRVKTIVPKILCNLFDLSALDILYKESLRCRSQIIPGRTFRRKKNKAIGRTHFNNKKVAF